jgi:hypothetical protein
MQRTYTREVSVSIVDSDGNVCYDTVKKVLNPCDQQVREILETKGCKKLKHALSLFIPAPDDPYISDFKCNCVDPTKSETCKNKYIEFVTKMMGDYKNGKLHGGIKHPDVTICGAPVKDTAYINPLSSALVATMAFQFLTNPNLHLEPNLKLFLITMFQQTLYGYYIACSTKHFTNFIGMTLPEILEHEVDADRFVDFETKYELTPYFTENYCPTQEMYHHVCAILCNETTEADHSAVVSFCIYILSTPAHILDSLESQVDTLMSMLKKINSQFSFHSLVGSGGEDVLAANGLIEFVTPCDKTIYLGVNQQDF